MKQRNIPQMDLQINNISGSKLSNESIDKDPCLKQHRMECKDIYAKMFNQSKNFNYRFFKSK